MAEVKFTGYPADAYEYWNVDQVLGEACEQALSRARLINSDKAGFMQVLQARYGAPATAQLTDVVPLVITSDSYHAGFPAGDVNVADLDILLCFASNLVPTVTAVSAAGIQQESNRLYETPSEACALLREYLQEPTAIRSLKSRVIRRELHYSTGLWTDDKEIRVRSVSFDLARSSEAGG